MNDLGRHVVACLVKFSLEISTAKCSDPSRDSNAQIVGNEFYNGKGVEFRYLIDHVLEPQNSQKLVCQKGRWNGTIPLCKGTTNKIFDLKNSKLYNKASYPHTKQALGCITQNIMRRLAS